MPTDVLDEEEDAIEPVARPGRRALLGLGAAALVSACDKKPFGEPGEIARGGRAGRTTTTSSSTTAPTTTSAQPGPSTSSTTTGPAATAPTTTTTPNSSTTSPTTTTTTTSAPSTAGTRGDRDSLIHLLQRATFGPTPDSIAELQSTGIDAWLDAQLDEHATDSVADSRVSNYPTFGWSNRQIRDWVSATGAWGTVAREQVAYTAQRAVHDRRQLREVMVEFWADHFHTNRRDDSVTLLKTVEIRDTYRRHALGTFRDLLHSSATSPAMLVYLDNAGSRDPDPNENYGRELLELSTVGVDGGYTEDDVFNAALALTGWTIDHQAREFRFRPEWHHTGPVEVMDWSSAGASGPEAVEQGRSLLDHLARHRATAEHIATKLCRRFVADVPPPALVQSTADIFQSNDTAIAPVLRHILTSDEFFAHRGTKLRRPFELLMATLRVVGADLDTSPVGTSGPGRSMANSISWWLEELDHDLYAYPDPTGYSDEAEDWVSTQSMLRRWWLTSKASRGTNGITVDVDALLARPETCGEMVDGFCDRLLFRTPTVTERTAMLGVLGRSSDESVTDAIWKNRRAPLIALVLATPSFQLR